MDEITKEVEAMAEKMEKSVQTQEFSLDLIKTTVVKLGPAGLKKAAASLTPEQKELLKEVLEDMKKSHKQAIPNKQESLEPVSNTTPDGDCKFNEDEKPALTEHDESLAEEARKRNQMEHRNQGGVPVEGWEGQVIKSETEAAVDIEKGGSGSGRKPIAPGQAGVESLKNLRSRTEETKDVQAKFESAPEAKKEAPAPSLEEKKKVAKANIKGIMKRMQEKKLEKAEACAKLSKALEVAQDKLEQIWDLLAKGDALAEKGNPEGSQSAVPSQMKGDTGAGPQTAEDPSVPKYKNKKASGPEMDDSGTPKTTADEGEQPPKPLKKSDGYFHEEEQVYFAKSEANPFAVRTIKPNAAYSVDALIESEANAQKERLSKSTFDYADDAETLRKSDDPTEVDVVAANAKKKAEAKRNDQAEVRGIKVDEKLSRIEGHSGPKMPFVKKMKKSVVDSLIEKALDMDQSTFDVAQANQTSAASGGFLVKSFNDSDMDALFTDQSMWKEEKK